MKTITPEGLFGYIRRDLVAFLPWRSRAWSGFVPATPRRREFYAFAREAIDRLEYSEGLTDGDVEAILKRWLQLRAPFVAPRGFRARPWNWDRYLKELPPMSLAAGE